MHVGSLSLATNLVAALEYCIPSLINLVIPCWKWLSLPEASWARAMMPSGVPDAILVMALEYYILFLMSLSNCCCWLLLLITWFGSCGPVFASADCPPFECG